MQLKAKKQKRDKGQKQSLNKEAKYTVHLYNIVVSQNYFQFNVWGIHVFFCNDIEVGEKQF